MKSPINLKLDSWNLENFPKCVRIKTCLKGLFVYLFIFIQLKIYKHRNTLFSVSSKNIHDQQSIFHVKCPKIPVLAAIKYIMVLPEIMVNFVYIVVLGLDAFFEQFSNNFAISKNFRATFERFYLGKLQIEH